MDSWLVKMRKARHPLGGHYSFKTTAVIAKLPEKHQDYFLI
jgi:hypothetical protein